jgi:hypothetical protein
MEDLAWQYPAEPVERAAVRFCEAIARWRGKPELETVRFHTRHCFVNPYHRVVQEEAETLWRRSRITWKRVIVHRFPRAFKSHHSYHGPCCPTGVPQESENQTVN